MLTIVTKPGEVQHAVGEIRAGGTDVQDRYALGISSGPIVDIYKLTPQFSQIRRENAGTTSIGSMVTLHELAHHPIITNHYAGLVKTANNIATPQIRHAATVGGALLQRTRCWFYRHPHYQCYKSGGNECPARDRHNPNGVIFDRGGCVYPHPSTLGMVLLAYEADIEIFGKGRRTVADLYGDGSDPTHDHMLEDGDLLTKIYLPLPNPNEKTAYFRATARAEAEWPMVECMVRLVIEEGVIQMARIGVGGVAAVPLRLTNVEMALENQSTTPKIFEQAMDIAVSNANPLPHTTYKLDFLAGALLEAIERAVN